MKNLYQCIWGICLLFLNTHSSLAASRFELVLDEKTVQPQQIGKVQSFLNEVGLGIPNRIKEVLSRPVKVEFSDFGDKSDFQPPLCPKDVMNEALLKEKISKLPRQKFGEQFENRVRLNKGFLPEIILGPDNARKYECGHKNLYRLAFATLIHEIGHLYDFSNETGVGKISGEPHYQRLASWRNEWGTSRAKNHLSIRSPDAYEYSSIEEHFAVNLEYYLLDPEYDCRRPILSGFLSNHFGIRRERQCALNTEVALHSFENHMLTDTLVDLKPDRVYEIHYFPATPGTGMGSQWGHAMFRIVTCSPQRTEVNQECLKDLDYHVVVSFRANVQDSVLSIWKALVGSYPSQVFLYPLNEVVEGYTRKELRDLRSLPLLFSKKEKNRFVLRVLEQYWEYQGAYYFFSNNCNTESVGLLNGVINPASLKTVDAYTPMGLQDSLQEQYMTSLAVLDNEEEAIRKGYLFKSIERNLERAFNKLLEFYKQTPAVSIMRWKSVWDFVVESSPNDRKLLLNELNVDPAISLFADQLYKQDEILASLYFLESYILLKKRTSLQNGLASRVDEFLKRMNKQLNLEKSATTLLGQTTFGSMPFGNLSKGYGIALEGDASPKASKVDPEIEQVKAVFQEWMFQTFPNERKEIDLIEANKKKIRKQLNLIFVKKS